MSSAPPDPHLGDLDRAVRAVRPGTATVTTRNHAAKTNHDHLAEGVEWRGAEPQHTSAVPGRRDREPADIAFVAETFGDVGPPPGALNTATPSRPAAL